MTTMLSSPGEPIVELRDCRKAFAVTTSALIQRQVGQVNAVAGVSFLIRQGETYSLVGESGSGKTTTARMILDVDRPSTGSVLFKGKSVATLTGNEYREYRAHVQAVFQDPWASLNPRMRVGSIILEPLLANRRVSRAEAREQLNSLLAEVGLRSTHAENYPHEFSGGQRQRIAIARALSLRPSLIVLDEPVSALDVSIRAQIMNLLRNLQERLGLSYLLISHDLANVRYMSHRVGVMYLGKIVEEATTRELFRRPLHPYTRALIGASLPSHPDRKRAAEVLQGEIPSLLNPPAGCAFHPRCPIAIAQCSEEVPSLRTMVGGRRVACILADDTENGRQHVHPSDLRIARTP